MILFVHQPEYMPWLGFFDKLAKCDTFIVYDEAQYQHGSYQNRNKIKSANGWQWLTIPIVHGHPQKLKDVKIAGTEWKNKHLAIITNEYRKAPHFKDYFPSIEKAMQCQYDSLVGLNVGLIQMFADLLALKPRIIYSSELDYCGYEKSEKLVSMCKVVGADAYLAGSGGVGYMNKDLFVNEEIKIHWHSYTHPTYPQMHCGFEPNLSVIDLLFNVGADVAKDIIASGGNVTKSPMVNRLLVTTRN